MCKNVFFEFRDDRYHLRKKTIDIYNFLLFKHNNSTIYCSSVLLKMGKIIENY